MRDSPLLETNFGGIKVKQFLLISMSLICGFVASARAERTDEEQLVLQSLRTFMMAAEAPSLKTLQAIPQWNCKTYTLSNGKFIETQGPAIDFQFKTPGETVVAVNMAGGTLPFLKRFGKKEDFRRTELVLVAPALKAGELVRIMGTDAKDAVLFTEFSAPTTSKEGVDKSVRPLLADSSNDATQFEDWDVVAYRACDAVQKK